MLLFVKVASNLDIIGRKEIRVAGERKSEAGHGIRYGVRNCAWAALRMYLQSSLESGEGERGNQSNPGVSSPSLPLTPCSARNSFQAPNHFSRHRYRILGRSRKRFASYHPFSYFISLAWHVCANKFLLYIENTFATRSSVEHINNDGTTPPRPVLSFLLSLLLLLLLLFRLLLPLQAFNF